MSYALVGGLAVSARTEPRFTRDLDLAVAVTGDPEAERLVGSLMTRGYAVMTQVEQEQTGRLATDPARRPQDRIDAINLARGASAKEIVEARATLQLITARSYQRDKDLAAELDSLLAELD